MHPVWKVRKQNFNPEELIDSIGCGRLLGAVLASRFPSPEKAYEFISTRKINPPFNISCMKDAVRLTLKHIANKSRILISGDYDTDGVCATAIVYRCLKQLGADVDYFLPVRENGYGFGEKAIEKAEDIKAGLIIILDTGTNDIEACQRAKGKGFDTIIIDHHKPLNGRPPVNVFVNPHYYEENDSYYCAAGLALKFTEGISMIKGVKIPIDLYVLAAIATVADVVPLCGENRYIVSKGIELWPHADTAGIKALRSVTGIEQANTLSLGYIIGPRLNAPGRVISPYQSLELLITDNEARAAELASEIEKTNAERRKLTDESEAVALSLIKDIADERAIVVADDRIHDGVAGIVAGKLSRRFNKPAIVMSMKGGLLRGSGRAPEGYDLVEAVKKVENYVARYGGHKNAIGLTVEPEKYEHFAEALKKNLPPSMPTVCEIDVRLDRLIEPSIDEVAELSILEPYGPGNPAPLFLARHINPSYIAKTSDGRHIRLKTGNMWMIWFSGAESYEKVKLPMDIAFEYGINEYNGKASVQGVVRAAASSISLTRENIELTYIALAQGDYESLESLGIAKYPALQTLLELDLVSLDNNGSLTIIPTAGKKDLLSSNVFLAYAG